MKADLDIEFIGGPYDGYHYHVDIESEPISDRVDIPVDQNVIRMTTGEEPGVRLGVRSIASYHLKFQAGALKYRFERYRSIRAGEEGDLRRWYSSIVQSARKAAG